ncbi:arsenite methyltransferase [Colletotrichum zoysiae]|uniref:Arsenite methyltransferase n=1 Tax=Colletotrichum zoysiae TaxID=1216348 RepID=A0AAD9LXL6_9PEZI|nr:arsenite methyltransferase [Colletotrichum zoysiae]
MNADRIYESVHDRYTAAARGVDQGYGRSVAKSFGYAEEELAGVPKDANLGLGAIASLQEGETVVDLGSGAGFDAFLAAGKVGPTGTVYGVDMNEDMVARANKSRAETPHRDNVSFVRSRITDVPLRSGVADCVISNCVVNLVPAGEKQLAFDEMARLLKPGGRLAISDVLLKQPLPDSLRSCAALYTGCIAGAGRVADYEEYLRAAGFHDVLITDTNADLNVYLETDVDGTAKAASGQGTGSRCCGPVAAKDGTAASCPAGQGTGSCAGKNADGDSEDGGCGGCGGGRHGNLNKWAGSYKIFAVKA